MYYYVQPVRSDELYHHGVIGSVTLAALRAKGY